MVEPLRAERIVIAIRTPKVYSKVIQILFGQSDGSVYVNFPYFTQSSGLISILTLAGGISYPTSGDLVPGGKVTSHLVKYSHHPDGRVHFSQDGKVKSTVRKQSIPLNIAEGHLFTVQLQGLHGFEAVNLNKDFRTLPSRKSVATFELQKSTINYEAFKLLGRWHSRKVFEQGIVGDISGPLIPAMKPDGQIVPGILVSAPHNYPFSDHFLLVTIENIPKLTQDEDTTLTFIGGFDPPSVIQNPGQSTSFLALVYPATDYSVLRSRIGNADFENASVVY